ncbi:MAG: STAS domain-containing protein [Desulfatiglans sp.]|jgi:anti-sigma B factor antagonist|nr:STAS domain-containing protein [Desulfatiglans sp.]
MDINEEIIDKVGVVKLTGRLDAASVKSFKDTVSSLVKKEICNIVVDMKDVEFIDSSGLGSLVSCLRIVNNEGGDIRLSSLQNQIRALLELTRMHRVFQIFDDTDTAIKGF